MKSFTFSEKIFFPAEKIFFPADNVYVTTTYTQGYKNEKTTDHRQTSKKYS